MISNLLSFKYKPIVLLVRYLIVGLSFMPWAVVYAWLSVPDKINSFVGSVLIVGGFLTAILAVHLFERRVSSRIEEISSIYETIAEHSAVVTVQEFKLLLVDAPQFSSSATSSQREYQVMHLRPDLPNMYVIHKDTVPNMAAETNYQFAA